LEQRKVVFDIDRQQWKLFIWLG